MGRPAAPVDVANIALGYLGEPPIANINPGASSRERLVSRFYDPTRMEMLMEIPWNFAKKIGYCSKLVATPAFGWTSQYQMPNDLVRFLCLATAEGLDDGYGSSERAPSRYHDIQGRVIMTGGDANTIPISYTYDVQDVTLWTAQFTDVVALKLAMKLAYPITKSGKVVEQLNALLEKALPNAMSIDGQERPPVRIQRSRILDARRFNSTRGTTYPGFYDQT